MRTLVLAVLLGMADAAAGASTDPQLLTVSWELLRSAGYGHATREHAAFLVMDGRGGLQLVPWPSRAASHRATYRGAIPAGTVAIVHTHPDHLPNPSAGDERVSRRLALPVYVLTRSRVTRTDGERTVQVALGDWNPAR
jgi:proteasome lid subunit RPN8/RPN11